jgi:arabinofuranosyltransferase
MKPLDRSGQSVILILCAAALVAGIGWKVFWFLTDDAYISFRYISHAHLGHGYVWNAPPFKPVEGYTSFLWVVLLDAVWRATGVAPPQAANPLALLFTLASLAIVARMVLRLTAAPARAPTRLPYLALALAGIVTNRTFLTWSSSGLETALFNALVIAWIYAGAFMRASFARRSLALSGCAAAIYLARPDGLLFAAATLPLVWLARPRDVRLRARHLASLAPLMLIVVHLIWRRSFYGAWLPNTYYAKYTGPWPASGWRYAASFLLEYVGWIWLTVAALVLVPRWPEWRAALRRELHARATAVSRRAEPGAAFVAAPGVLARTLVAAVVIAHALYYTFIIGGDHFEYRVYSHLVPLIFVALVWLLTLARVRMRTGALVFAATVLLALPVPWTHWALTHNLRTREATFQMRVPVAPHWPAPVRGYARVFDGLQDWLIERLVCVRHQEHRALQQLEIELYPSRAEGAVIGPAGHPVFAALAVGVPGWVMPNADIIDLWGLNDYVIAHTDPGPTPIRHMAHDRRPPAGYVESFQPNVFPAGSGRMQIKPRDPELTDAQIIANETRWRAWTNGRR